jgi:hypothetical protein
VPTRRETRSQERGGGQDDVAVIGKLWIVSSATLVHTETTARYPEHRLHMTSVGRLSSPSAPATTPEAGVRTVDRVSSQTPRYPVDCPYFLANWSRKQAAPPTIRPPALHRNIPSGNPDPPDQESTQPPTWKDQRAEIEAGHTESTFPG